MSFASRFQVASPDPLAARRLADALDLAAPTALVLVGRGLSDAAEAERFLAPRLGALRGPASMAGFERAVTRLAQAVQKDEPIGIFGDYDVDGITTAALLASFLGACGARVEVRLARRSAGYGFGLDDAAALTGAGCRVIVTGDCGTSDHEAVLGAQAAGADVIVVDHHEVPARPSPAHALLNPHQPGCGFPFKGLASVGVAFYLAAALRTRLREAGHFSGAPPDPRAWLDLVAVGTICDLAPLVDENRILVGAGLRVLGELGRPGLRALAGAGGLAPGARPSAFDVGFRLGPRLNAPGRLGDPEPALRLLLCQSETEAARWLAACETANAERQRIQDQVLTAALSAVERGEAGEAALLCAGDGWHPGVVGIVAAKLCERFGRPAAVLAGQDGLYRGSVRAVPGFHAQRALSQLAPLLERFGGHAGAAGLTVTAANLEAVRRGWEELGRAAAAESPGGLGAAAASVVVDCEVGLEAVDERVADELGRLGPFGIGNPEPVLSARAETVRTRVVAQDHLQLVLGQGGVRRDAIAFRFADRDPGPGSRVRVAFVPEIDRFRGQRRLRLRVRGLEADA